MRYTFALSLLTMTSFASFAVAQNEGQGAPEIIKHGTNPHDAGSVTAGGTASLSPISYNGGALLPTPTIYLIWYGNWAQSNGSDTAAGQQIVQDFAANIGGSPYFGINTTYSAGGYIISGSVAYGGETLVAYPYGSRLRDSSILNIVNDAITMGHLPYNPTGVYFVLTSSDVTETSGFCSKYCGWHTAASPSAGHVRYSFVGNATTDADPRSGWVDSGGSENADKCAWTFGSAQYTTANGATANMMLGSRNFRIQRNLKATDNKCYVNATQQ